MEGNSALGWQASHWKPAAQSPVTGSGQSLCTEPLNDQARGVLQRPAHPIYSLAASLQPLSCLQLGRHANNPVNIILGSHPTAPNPANKSCPFAEMEGCDPGCLSHYILLLLSHFGDRTDISTKGWKRTSKRDRERVPYLCLAAFICGIIRATLAAFRISRYKFLVHANAYVEGKQWGLAICSSFI